MDPKILREAALAYQAVYDEDLRQELEEDNILQENAEIWVSECILNGVDFSQYTLDELTEAFLIDCEYLIEDAAGRAGLNIGAGARQLFGRARRAVGSAISGAARGAVDTAGAAAQGLAGQRTTSSNPVARLANTATRVATAPQRFAARAAQGFVTGQGSGGSGSANRPAGGSGSANRPAGGSGSAPAVNRPSGGSGSANRPAGGSGSANRPAGGSGSAPASNRPASAPTAKPSPTPSASAPAKPTPTAPPPKAAPTKIQQDVADLRRMGAASMMRQQGRNLPSGKIPTGDDLKPATKAPVAKPSPTPSASAPAKPTPTPAASTPKPTPTPATAKPTPTTQRRPMGSVKPGSLVSSFDMFDIVKGYLIDEGYADTEDAAISIMASMSEDWKTAIIAEARAEGVKAYRPNPTQAEVRADAAKAAKKKAEKAKGQSGYGPEEKFKDWKDRATPASTLKRKGGETETVSQRMDREKPYGKRMTGQMAREYGSRHAAEVTRVVKGAGEPQAVTYPRKGRDEKKKVSREIVRKEELELYNYILSHLLDEGYASDVETAEGIIENMSDEWIMSILG